jgi:hypothetical protein
VCQGYLCARVASQAGGPSVVATLACVPTTCDSCGDRVEDLTPVRRQYVTPAAWDTEGKVETVAEVEQWCVVCLLHYPHERA